MQYWYALHTKPRKERSLSENLSARDLETYLPLLPRVHGGRRLASTEPLFPNYLFARFDLDTLNFASLRWTPGLRDVVSGAEGAAPVGDDVIEHIRTRLAQGQITRSAAHDRFKAHEPVRVKGHPFDDLDAVFEHYLPGEARARVLLHILGRATPTDIPVELLEKTSPLRGHATV